MRNTHSAFIVGNGFSAFIDGIPNDHECDSKGDVVYRTASGKTVRWYTIRKWAHLTTEARDPLLQRYFEEIGDPICSGSCTCSKCGSVLMDEMIWL